MIKRIQEANLKVGPTKCGFAQSVVKLLRHMINDDGAKMDATKIKDILEIPASGDLNELKSFLGLIGYCKRFRENLNEGFTALHDARFVEKKLNGRQSCKRRLSS